MEIDKAAASEYDFSAARAAMQRYVDQEPLAGISHAVLRGRTLVEVGCAGWADREQRIPLAPEHLFRIFSSTKLVTSCAALLLWEEGRFALDDPIERYLPQLGRRRVLKPGATHLDDTEPARSPITIRHLMSHSSGLSLGLLDPGTLIFNAYAERGAGTPERRCSAAAFRAGAAAERRPRRAGADDGVAHAGTWELVFEPLEFLERLAA